MGLQHLCAALRSDGPSNVSECSSCMLSRVMLFSGVKILFRVGLVLLKCMLGSQEKLKACQGLYETMELLRAIQPQYTQEGFLVHEVQLYSVTVVVSVSHFIVLIQHLLHAQLSSS